MGRMSLGYLRSQRQNSAPLVPCTFLRSGFWLALLCLLHLSYWKRTLKKIPRNLRSLGVGWDYGNVNSRD